MRRLQWLLWIEVEKYVLESGAFEALRFYQRIPNKRGRFPSLDAVVLPDIMGTISHTNSEHIPLVASFSYQDAMRLMGRGNRAEPSVMLLGQPGEGPKENVMSRFLAKIALEALAQRVMALPGALDELAQDPQFDPIRNHARRGHPRNWEFHQRRIYDMNRYFDEAGELVQTLYEYDLLLTHPERITPEGAVYSELYFVLCIMGIEFVIGFANTDVVGYRE